MNDEPKKPDIQTWIEPELEARIVAWVSGEASAFEAAELERLSREKPELAIFKRRIEAVRGLVAEALAPEKQPLRLSGEGRAKLLKAIGIPEQPAAPAPAEKPAVPTMAVFIQKHRRMRRTMLAIAACLVGALLLTMSIPSFQKVRTPKEAVLIGLPASAPAFDMERDVVATDSVKRKELKAAHMGLAGRSRNGPVALQLPAAPSEGLELGYTEAPGASPSPAARNSLPLAYAAPGREPIGRVAADLDQGASSVSAVSNRILQQAGAANSQSANLASDAEDATLASKAVGGAVLDSFSVAASQADFGAVQKQQSILEDAGPLQPLAQQTNKQQQGVASADASATSQDEVVKLSPFVVDASQDKGSYQANSTLAGSRVRAGLGDVASAVSVVTGQFLEDTGGKDLKKTGGIGAPVAVNDPAAEASADKEPVSTFSLHVSDVSFRLAQDAFARGEAPDPARIRPEEFYNAFDYGDPAPAMSEKVSCRIEQAADPVRQQRNLVRIAMRVPATGHGAAQPLRLTVLLDTSGSMEREDRAAAVRRAVEVLASLLGPADRVTLVGFSRQPRLLADQLPGDKAGTLLDIIAHTPAEGGTNLEEALKLGGELARRQFLAAAQNRIVLLTDGAANLGNADPAQLAGSIGALRQQGISFDACGVGIDGINDEILEALTRKGAGRYYVVDTPESADSGFARQLAGAFRPAAENVKVQVRFNPARVGHYRLIGFEQHRLSEQDFRNDRVEAAALAAGEAAVALYEVEALPQGEGELGEVYVRFRDTTTGSMVERSWTLPFDPYAPAFDKATPTLQLAGTAALLAEKLRGGATGDAIRLAPLAPVVNALRGHYAHEPRVQALVAMFDRMRRLEKE